MNYWISPEGIIMPTKDHYTSICCDPDRFMLSKDHIKEARQAGVKGSEELMRLLLHRGWMRITSNGHFYTVEFERWTLAHRGHIRTWMSSERLDGVKVHLVSLDGRYNRTVMGRVQV